MTTLVIAGLLFLGLPLALLFLFRTNAGVMFLAATAGLVLLGSLDPTVITTASAVVPGEGEAYVRLSIVILSILLAAMMFKGSVKGSTLFLHAGIIVFLAGTLWVLLPGATGVSWLIESTKESVWQNFYDFRSLIIAAGFSTSLLAVLTRTKGHRSRH